MHFRDETMDIRIWDSPGLSDPMIISDREWQKMFYAIEETNQFHLIIIAVQDTYRLTNDQCKLIDKVAHSFHDNLGANHFAVVYTRCNENVAKNKNENLKVLFKRYPSFRPCDLNILSAQENHQYTRQIQTLYQKWLYEVINRIHDQSKKTNHDYIGFIMQSSNPCVTMSGHFRSEAESLKQKIENQKELHQYEVTIIRQKIKQNEEELYRLRFGK